MTKSLIILIDRVFKQSDAMFTKGINEGMLIQYYNHCI